MEERPGSEYAVQDAFHLILHIGVVFGLRDLAFVDV